jgi:hypothetical protein
MFSSWLHFAAFQSRHEKLWPNKELYVRRRTDQINKMTHDLKLVSHGALKHRSRRKNREAYSERVSILRRQAIVISGS